MKQLSELIELLLNQYFFLRKKIQSLNMKQYDADLEKSAYNLILVSEYNGKLEEILLCLRLLEIHVIPEGLKWGKYCVVLESEELEDGKDYIVILKNGTYNVVEIVGAFDGYEYDCHNYSTLEELMKECF